MKIMSCLFLFCTLFINAAYAADSRCVARRAAFDVGSGTTKMIVADVDTCTQNIVQIIGEYQEKVDYKEDLAKNGDHFSDEVQMIGKQAFQSLKQKAIEQKVSENNFAGVATSAFRDSKNGAEYLTEIANNFGVKITIISQEEEGVLGFYSAMTKVKEPLDKMVVWDIGGGSMQMTIYDRKDFIVFEGDLASVSFKNRVLNEVQKSQSSSPNPMSVADETSAAKLSEKHAANTVDARVKNRIRAVGGKVFGIGSVHGISRLVKNLAFARFS